METSLHNIADLTAEMRSVVETLVGHPLHNGQKLYIATVDQVDEAPRDRERAWDEFEAILEEARDNVGKAGLNTDEVERIIDATCDEVRYGQRR